METGFKMFLYGWMIMRYRSSTPGEHTYQAGRIGPGGRYLSVVSLMLLAVCLMILVTGSAKGDGHGEYPPPADGDWVIGKDTYVGNETIELNGNLIVNRFGNLTLRNVTLAFKNQEQGQYGIEVRSEGALKILDLDDNPKTRYDRSIIKSDGKDKQFLFIVKAGAGFVIENSEVSECGYEWGTDGRAGLTILAKNTRVVNTEFHHCYNGLYVQSEFNEIIGCTMADNENYGMYVVSSNNNIRDCIADRNVNGIYLMGSDSNITGCRARNNANDGITIWGSTTLIADCNASFNNNSGFSLSSSQWCELWNCAATKNGNYGLYQDWYSTNNDVRNGNFSGNGVGLYIMKDFFGSMNITGCNVWDNSLGCDISASNVKVKGINAWNNEIGIQVAGSNNKFIQCNSSNNDLGFMVQSFSESNHFENCTAYGNNDHAFYSLGNSQGNTITRLTIHPSPVTLSFFYNNGIGIRPLQNPPPDPANRTNIGKFVGIDNVTRTSWINLDVYYTDDEIYHMLEPTLRMYRFTKDWEEIPGSKVIAQRNVVNANISSFSPFAVLGEPNPLEQSVENLDTRETFYFIQEAIDAPGTKDGHTIKVDPRTYKENVEIYKEVEIIGDPLIEADNGIGIWIQVSNVHVENMAITNGTIGVYLYNQSHNITGITLHNIMAYNNDVGISLWRAHQNTLVLCNVSGNKEMGFLLREANENTIINAHASGISGDGVNLENAYDNTITNLTAEDNSGVGVGMEYSNDNLLMNVLAGGNDKGFHLYQSSGNTMMGCSALGNSYEGFYIHSIAEGVANSNELINCQAISNENGISISGDRFSTEYGSNFNAIRNCNVSENDWNGIWLWGADFTEIEDTILFQNDVGIDISYTSSDTVMVNSRIIESNDMDIDLRSDAMGSVAVNSTFIDVSCDESSSLVVRNFLHILARDALGNPLTGADVQVKEDDTLIYATALYGGSDPATDAQGMVSGILVTDRGYFGSSTATEIITNVSVGYAGEEIGREVQMDRSHLETFNFRIKLEAFIDSIEPNNPMEGELITFSGHGAPAGSIDTFVWRSDLDGELYNGSEGNFTTGNLSPGDHTISLRVRDRDGSWSKEVSHAVTLTVKNILPTAVIQSIVPSPASEGELITFTGTGIDGQGVILEYQWSSSLLGKPLSLNAVFSTSSLAPGNHTINFRVRDNEGSWSNAVSVPLFINALPVARIESIDPSIDIYEGDQVHFIGSGTDPGGTITAYEWSSSIQGLIGNSATFTSSGLTPGNHTISLRVRDNDGAWSEPFTWNIRIIGVSVGEDAWFIITIREKDDMIHLKITLTPRGRQHLGEISAVRLWLNSLPLEKILLFNSSEPDSAGELWGKKLFDPEDFILSRNDFSLNGSIDAALLPNDRYTIRMEALDQQDDIIEVTEAKVTLENPRNTWGPALGSVGVGVMVGGAGELMRGKGGAGAEGAAVEGEVKPFRVRSKIKQKLLKKNPLLSLLSFVVAVTVLVLAFGYTMMVSPTRSPGDNLELFNTFVLSNRPAFFSDITVMLPYLLAVMGVIILFRLWVDKLASRVQGIETAFRPSLSGIVSLGLSTTLFGTPYGYPAQSIHESQPGHDLKEARIAGARIIGLLVLLLPFWLAWNYLEEYRFFNELGIWLVLMCAFTISLPLGGGEGRMVWKQDRWLGFLLLALTASIYFGWQMLYLHDAVLPIIGAGALLVLPLFLRPAPVDETLIQPAKLMPPVTPPAEVHAMFAPPPQAHALLPACDFCGNPVHENAVPCPFCSSPMHDVDPRTLYAFFLRNMKDTNPRIRSATLTAMGPYLMKHRDLQSMMEGALSDNDGLVRQAALRALAPMLSEQGDLAGVLGNLINDAFPLVRQAAIEVLTPYLSHNEFLFPDIQRNLFDMDEYVRGTAIQALAPFLPQRQDLIADFRNLMDDHLDSVRSIAMGAVSPLFSGNPWLKDMLFSKKKEEVEEVAQEPKVPTRICPGCGHPMEVGWRSCPFCLQDRDTGPAYPSVTDRFAEPREMEFDETEAFMRRTTSILGYNLARNFGGNVIDGGRSIVLTDFEEEELVVHTGDMGLQWMGRGLSLELPVDSIRSGRDILRIDVSPDIGGGTSAANISIEGSREILERWGSTLQQTVWDGILDSIDQGELTVGEGGGFVSPPGMNTSDWPQTGGGIYERASRSMYRISGFVLGGRSMGQE